MNKRFSTLVAAFAAIATVSYAQIGDKYVHLKANGSANYLTVTKENSAKADSVKLANLGGNKAAKDSALWLPKFVEKMVSGDSVFQFVNKATKKNLSFAVKKNGAGAYGTMIAPGVDKFVFKTGVAGGSEIYAAYGQDSIVSISTTSGKLNVATTLPNEKFEVEAPASISLATVADLAGKLSTFKFEFKGKDGGIFTATDLIPVPVNGKYRFQVVGQEKSTKGTKKDQYITIDTTMIGSTTSIQVAAFKLDTIVAAGGADLYDIWRILSAGKQDPVFRAIGSAVSDLHGSVGNVRRLFFLYRGEFHDRKKQTGKGGFGKYFDPDDLLPAALAVPQTAGGEKDHSRILDAVGSGDDFLLSGKYHGSVAGLYADGSGRDLRSCLL